MNRCTCEPIYTRDRALLVIDYAANDPVKLRAIARAWNLAGWWNDHATWTADELREHVADECLGAWDTRSGKNPPAPDDSDDTGLPLVSDPLHFDGFERIGAGGGCTALYTILPDDRSILITGDNMAAPDFDDAARCAITCGLYDTRETCGGLPLDWCENVAENIARETVARWIAESAARYAAIAAEVFP
jgi:hypothetical protein